MDRISHSTAVDIGGGRNGYRSKDTVAGLPGTVLTATQLNAKQEEMMAVIEEAGDDPDPNDLKQIVKVIRGGRLNWRTAGGTANALTVALAPQLLAYVAGLPLRILTGANANTGAMTLNVDGLGAKAIVKRSGAAMVAGDVPADSLLELVYDGVAFRLVGLVSSDITTVLTAEGGRILNYRVYRITGRTVVTAPLNPGLVLWTQAYTKLKAGSTLVLEAMPSLRLVSAVSTTYARGRLNGIAGTDRLQNHYLFLNNSGENYQPPQPGKFIWEGIAAGALTIEYRVGQQGVSAGTVVVNPIPSDGGGWVNGFETVFVVYEVEN